MATTGPIFPGTAASVSSAPWSDDAWVNPGNITAAGAVYSTITAATYDSGDQSHRLRATNFNFSAIPDGSTINGIIVVAGGVEWVAGTAGIGLLQLVNAGTPIGENKYTTEQAVTSTPTNYTKGTSTDLWTATLTSAIVKSSTFGVDFGMWARSANTDVYIDFITMEVYYTAPPAQNYTWDEPDAIAITDLPRKGVDKRPNTELLGITDTIRFTLQKGITDTLAITDIPTPNLTLAGLIYRVPKGSFLTAEEFDGNFTLLNTRKLETVVDSIVTATNITPSGTSQYNVTALAIDAVIEPPAGVPVDGQSLLLRIKDNGTPRNLLWNNIWRGIGCLLTDVTDANQILSITALYNAQDSKWDVIGLTKEGTLSEGTEGSSPLVITEFPTNDGIIQETSFVDSSDLLGGVPYPVANASFNVANGTEPYLWSVERTGGSLQVLHTSTAFPFTDSPMFTFEALGTTNNYSALQATFTISVTDANNNTQSYTGYVVQLYVADINS